MPRPPKRTHIPRPPEDYVGLISSGELTLSMRRHAEMPAWESAFSRRLTLRGRMVFPAALRGQTVEAHFFADVTLQEQSTLSDAPCVAALARRPYGVVVSAALPLEFLMTLSAAVQDGRIDILHGVGPGLFRNKARLGSLSFCARAGFESDWGEPLPRLPG